jgi:hypothetical protein
MDIKGNLYGVYNNKNNLVVDKEIEEIIDIR